MSFVMTISSFSRLCQILLNYSLTVRHINGFQLSTIINNSAMNFFHKAFSTFCLLLFE